MDARTRCYWIRIIRSVFIWRDINYWQGKILFITKGGFLGVRSIFGMLSLVSDLIASHNRSIESCDFLYMVDGPVEYCSEIRQILTDL